MLVLPTWGAWDVSPREFIRPACRAAVEVVIGWGQQFISFVLSPKAACFFAGWEGGVGTSTAGAAVLPACPSRGSPSAAASAFRRWRMTSQCPPPIKGCRAPVELGTTPGVLSERRAGARRWPAGGRGGRGLTCPGGIGAAALYSRGGPGAGLEGASERRSRLLPADERTDRWWVHCRQKLAG